MTYPANALQFALEEDDSSLDRYHRIHAAGCLHLRDPNPIGAASTFDELANAAAMLTSEFDDPADVRAAAAPCVARVLRSAR